VRQELRNGAEGYLVHALRQGYELRRARLHYSGGPGPRLKLGQASRPPGEAIRGLGSSGGGREWSGHGGRPQAALTVTGRSPELRASSGDLGAVRRRQRGRWPCTRVGFIAAREHGTGVGTGVADHTRGRARQRPVRARPIRQGIEHVAAFVLVIFKRRLGRDLFVSIQNPCIRFLPCCIPFISHAVLEWV
jgi:hypothetical protein